MLPVLLAAENGEVNVGEMVKRLENELGLIEDEKSQLLPSGRQRTFPNRMHWEKNI